ncbi:MAG: hypothetical protein MK212_09265 [Saprospiraceae bacterium]|nr:hypothetical protein [Saprospiraceae bacterium]
MAKDNSYTSSMSENRRIILFLIVLPFMYGLICGQICLEVVPHLFSIRVDSLDNFILITFWATVLIQMIGNTIYQFFKKDLVFSDFLKRTIPISIISGLGLFYIVAITSLLNSGQDPFTGTGVTILLLIIMGFVFTVISAICLIVSVGLSTLIWRFAIPDGQINKEILDERIKEEPKRWE